MSENSEYANQHLSVGGKKIARKLLTSVEKAKAGRQLTQKIKHRVALNSAFEAEVQIAKAEVDLKALLAELEKPVASETKAAAHQIVWPSGHGNEIGTMGASIGDLFLHFLGKHKKNQQKVRFIDDDGITACIISGIARGPITLVADEMDQSDRLSIVADSGADVPAVRHALKRVFGHKIELSFHPI